MGDALSILLPDASLLVLHSCVGMRVANIYDIDQRTYLFKLAGSGARCVLLVESGIRIHSTGFEWPKSVIPSGFSMKVCWRLAALAPAHTRCTRTHTRGHSARTHSHKVIVTLSFVCPRAVSCT